MKVQTVTQGWNQNLKASNDQSIIIIIMAINADDTVVPTKPNQPLTSFQFPKRSFGKTKIVERSCQSSWFSRWSFLHYDEGKDALFYHMCLLACKLKKMKTTSRADPVSNCHTHFQTWPTWNCLLWACSVNVQMDRPGIPRLNLTMSEQPSTKIRHWKWSAGPCEHTNYNQNVIFIYTYSCQMMSSELST